MRKTFCDICNKQEDKCVQVGKNIATYHKEINLNGKSMSIGLHYDNGSLLDICDDCVSEAFSLGDTRPQAPPSSAEPVLVESRTALIDQLAYEICKQFTPRKFIEVKELLRKYLCK